jgi:predicted nuclease of predicted toxin-antitoxin system
VIAFLLDQGGSALRGADRLRSAGYDAVHTSSIDLASAADEAILERARKDNGVVVTLDADFHPLLATSAARQPSTIRIRQEGQRGEKVARIVVHVVATGEAELQAGVVVTIRDGRIRWRKLPI